MKTRVCLNYFLHDCLCKQVFASNSPQAPLKLICLTIFVTLRPLTQFYCKLEGLSHKKVLKLILLVNYFSDFSTEV